MYSIMEIVMSRLIVINVFVSDGSEQLQKTTQNNSKTLPF